MDQQQNDPQLGDRLKTIVGTEKQIDELMKCSKDCLQELLKDRQISKTKMEETATTFRRLINQVENELNNQMQYLSNVCVGSAHQGSTFGSLQNSHLAEVGTSSLYKRLEEITEKYMPKNEEIEKMIEEEEEKEKEEETIKLD
ncbi:unnamed protein product [Caenorhabditis angaria]|uniref:Mediator of RNA polymerase II transcription subunit 11 n=1 Tax=Caenorhabditis angaria TaxID=860376 RepID=A0A9P1II04_9PELO|nr:unnamed protein product [Caenorhabditis angaria]